MEERADKEAEADRAPSRLSAISFNLSARALAFVKCIFPCRQNLFFKRIGGFLALLGVEPNIWLEPCRLGEGEDATDYRQLHPESYALLKIAVVDDVFGLVSEVRHELRGRAADANLIV